MNVFLLNAIASAILALMVVAGVDAHYPPPKKGLKLFTGRKAIRTGGTLCPDWKPILNTGIAPSHYKYVLTTPQNIQIVTTQNITLQPHSELYNYMMINAAHVVNQMCSAAPPWACETLAKLKFKVALKGFKESSKSLPEGALEQYEYEGVFMWINEALGRKYPLNIVDGPTVGNSKNGIYFPENVLVHEFAHAIHSSMFYTPDVGSTLIANITNTYNKLKETDLFKGRYIRTNDFEMFAVASHMYFNGIRYQYEECNTREQLKSYAQGLYEMARGIYGDYEFNDFCTMSPPGTTTSTTTSTTTTRSKATTSTIATISATATTGRAATTTTTANTITTKDLRPLLLLRRRRRRQLEQLHRLTLPENQTKL
ncbi:hypothetical protein HDV05_007608 [Chytridiales sp. JEL 0842]|nr:hypothetical protein HDV05_007608 [Chytridiales sp. JEL 0842]